MDMDGPALMPPDGVAPELDHPDNRNQLADFVLGLSCAVSTLCVLIRAYGRVYLLKKFHIEDALIISAFGIFWGCVWAAFQFRETPGYYVHQWDVRLRDLIPMTYYVIVMGNIYGVVLMLLKVAMLAEWSRLLVPRGARTTSVFWWGCIVMITLQLIAGIGITVATNLQCIPHAAIWDFTLQPTAKCFPLYDLQLSSAIFYTISDVIMFFMPQRIIWGLKLPWQKKLGVSVIFGLGALACVAAGMRLQVTVVYGHATDATYNLGDVIFWAMAEMTCGFFITCMPCVAKILHETKFVTKIKKNLGVASRVKEPSNDYYGRSGLSHTANSLPNTTSKAYYKLEEDGVRMEHLNNFESSENLRGDNLNGSGRIIRTTAIVVDDAPNVDGSSESSWGAHGTKQAWAV